MLDVDGCVGEAGFDDTGEIFIVFDEEDVGRAVSGVEDAAEFGEEEALVEGFLDPSLGVAGELGAECGGEDAEDDDRDVSGGRVVAETLERLPAAETGHVEVEEDSLDAIFSSKDERLVAGRGFYDVVALAGEVVIDDGADAFIVVADQDGTLADDGFWNGSGHVGGAYCAWEHNV